MRNSVPIRPDFRPSCGSTVAIKVTRCTADSKNQIRVSQIVSATTCVVPARNNFNLNFVVSFTTCVLASDSGKEKVPIKAKPIWLRNGARPEKRWILRRASAYASE